MKKQARFEKTSKIYKDINFNQLIANYQPPQKSKSEIIPKKKDGSSSADITKPRESSRSPKEIF
jgi:hypothetical protein